MLEQTSAMFEEEEESESIEDTVNGERGVMGNELRERGRGKSCKIL